MKYFIHFGQTVEINSSPKGVGCSVGPFETEEEAQKWVEKHSRLCGFHIETATATDPRLK